VKGLQGSPLPGLVSSPTAPERKPQKDSTTAVCSTNCWPAASSPSALCTTGTSQNYRTRWLAEGAAIQPGRSPNAPAASGKLSDRVDHFMTMNGSSEHFVVQDMGRGTHAPGPRLMLQVSPRSATSRSSDTATASSGHSRKSQSWHKSGLADNAVATTCARNPERDAAKAMRRECHVPHRHSGRPLHRCLSRAAWSSGAGLPRGTSRWSRSSSTSSASSVHQPTYVRADASPKGLRARPPPGHYPRGCGPCGSPSALALC